MRVILSLAVFIPTLLILLISEESLKEGVYTKSPFTIITFILMALAVNYVCYFSKIKKESPKFWSVIVGIIILGLSIPAIF